MRRRVSLPGAHLPQCGCATLARWLQASCRRAWRGTTAAIDPMDASAWYPALRHAHIGLVALSGSVFALRGAAVLAGQAWPLHRPWRLLSMGIDSLLLAAGLGLWTLLQLHPVHSPWLGTKLLLLPVYVVLGTLALKRARTPAGQRLAYVAALCTLLFMVTVARAHHPLGLLLGRV